MPDIVRNFPSPTSPGLEPWQSLGKPIAAEAIAAGDNLYISGWDASQRVPLVSRAGGPGATGAALRVRGQAARRADINEPVTLCQGALFGYGTGLNVGADVFLSGATPGATADAAVGTAAPIGYVFDDQNIQFFFPN